MPASTLGINYQGNVTSWGATSGFTYSLINSGLLSKSANLTILGDVADVTTFSSSGTKVNSYVKGLKSWSVDMEFELSTPRMGNLGSISYTDLNGTDAILKEWTITINALNADVTPLNSSWRVFTPGPINWTASAKGFMDTAIAAYGPVLTSQPSSATFTIVSGGTGKQLAGNLIGTSTKLVNTWGSVAEIEYEWRGTSELSTTGSATYLWAADGGSKTVTIPETGKTLTFQSNSGLVYSGAAHWTKIVVSNKIDSPVRVSINAVGQGALSGTGVSF